jgi:PTS system nitrogen regulatory IIA component
MQLQSILTPGRTLNSVPGISKKRVIDFLAKHIADDHPALDEDKLFDALMAREKLGSTGLGGGIAIPHCRLNNCTESLGSLIKLQSPIEFDAIDDKPIDILFVLIVPEEATDEHLQILSTLARLFSQAELLKRLRESASDEELYATLIEFQQEQAA